MRLLFKDGKEKERLIAEPTNREELFDAMEAFLDKINFESYYMRVIEGDNCLKIDFGSWSKFFIVEGISYEEWLNKRTNNESIEK